MTADDIIKIINYIPDYILYVYPGYLTIYCYFFFRAKTIPNDKFILIKSIVISYIYVSLTDFIPVENISLVNIGYISLSIIVAYIAYRITISEKILTIYRKFKIYTTYYGNEVEALAGARNGAWLIVYLKGENVAIEGSLGYKELEEGKERYIILESYIKRSVGNDNKLSEIPIISYEGNYEEKITIKYDDIRHIERRDA